MPDPAPEFPDDSDAEESRRGRSETGGEQLRVRRRRRRRRSGEDEIPQTATEAAGIQLDAHNWHAGGRNRARDRSRGGKDSGKRNVNPLVQRSNRVFIRIALGVLTAVALFATYHQGFRMGQIRTEMKAKASSERALDGRFTEPGEARRRALLEVEKGFEARVAGNLTEALARFQAAKDTDPRLPGAYVEMGTTWLRLRNPVEADSMFLKAIRANEDAWRGHYNRGIVLAGSGSFPEAEVEFRTATEKAPFDPYPWFYWGEALRTAGKPSAAIEKLQSAEARATEQSDLFVIRAKRVMCMIEADAKGIATEIATAVSGAEPAGEWLLAAAAQHLRAGDYAAAAGMLARARKALQPVFFDYLFADKFFDLYRGRPEIQAALPPR